MFLEHGLHWSLDNSERHYNSFRYIREQYVKYNLCFFSSEHQNFRKVAELNNTQIAYTEIKYYESEKLFPVDLVLASDLIYDSEGTIFCFQLALSLN